MNDRVREHDLWLENQPKELKDKFQFFRKLFEFVRQQGAKVMSNDSTKVREVFMHERSAFQWPSHERTGCDMIAEFFNEENFIKRLILHQ